MRMHDRVDVVPRTVDVAMESPFRRRCAPPARLAADEVLGVWGRAEGGGTTRAAIAPEGTRAVNPAFDVTPARLVTGLITERGVTRASAEGLAALFPERYR